MPFFFNHIEEEENMTRKELLEAGERSLIRIDEMNKSRFSLKTN